MELHRATDGKHKWIAEFADGTRVPFGAVGYKDYTQHHDKLRRANYLSRHRSSESWSNPKTAGSLSRWILWGDSTSLQANLQAFKRRFSLG
jgi:Family of unknown function (DUF5754)